MDDNEKKLREEAEVSLKRIQEFQTNTLSRVNDLGTVFEFTPTIKPAKKLLNLFDQVPLRILEELPLPHVKRIKQQADALYNIFHNILDFDASQNDAANARNNIINQINTYYDKLFDSLFNVISYAVSRTVDFKSLESEGRAAVQSVEDKTDDIIRKLNTYESQAEETLEQVRKAAAEQGVSQQASYFKAESDLHEKKSEEWQKTTTKMAILLGIYGILAIFAHKIPFIAPDNGYESAQLIASKVIIFFVLTYILSLSAKNFLSHKHNSIVNRHRQNALMTFTALVKAAGQEETRDIILNHASSCIFSPQDTGYIKGTQNSSEINSRTIIESLPKSVIKLDGAV